MVTMSQKELQRVKVIENAVAGRLSVSEAARLLQLSERQVQRLKRRYQPDSIDGVHHGNRGRVMPWAVSLPQKQLIVSLARGKYRGFNDSHLTEKLRAEEHLSVGREAVRRILRAAKLASPQKRRPRQYRSRRPPRPRFGMMALTDASRHDWLQGRGYAGETLELPINSTAPGASIAATPCCSPCLCRCKNTPTADPASSLQRRKEKIRCHASITSPAAPLWRPLLKRYGGDRISLQLIRHFLVATTLRAVRGRPSFPQETR